MCEFVADNYFVLIPDAAMNLLSEAHGSFLADLSYKLARMALESMAITGKLHGDPEEKYYEIAMLQTAYDAMNEECARLQEDIANELQEIQRLKKRERHREQGL